MNAERVSRGLAPLSENLALRQVADRYARTLLQLGTLSHDAGGTTLTGRVQAAGYSGWSLLGEALWSSRGFLPPERVVADWLASPGHRDIILDSRFNDSGVACAFRQGATLHARCVLVVAAR